MRIVFRRLRPDEVDHELVWSLVIAASLVLAVAGSVVVGHLPMACAFKGLTGLPCPTCGVGRAVAAMAAGHPLDALRLNPLASAAGLGALVWAPWATAASWRGWRRLRLEVASGALNRLRLLVVTVVVAQWLFLVLDGR